MSRTAWIVSGALAALLVASIIIGLVVINAIRTQADDEAYRRCLASQGFADPSAGNVDDMARAADWCSAHH